MSSLRGLALALPFIVASALVGAVACSSNGPDNNPLNTGSGPGGPGSGGSSSSSSSSGDGGKGPKCGNGKIDKGEQCDESHFAMTCESLGFLSGTLKCSPNCHYDTSGCKGDELCQNGTDDDGDGKVDCDDPDCAMACADPCVQVPVLTDPSNVTGLSTGHAVGKAISCVLGKPGPQVVYEITPKNTGVLTVDLEADQPIDIAVRPACADAAGELGCVTGELLTRSLTVPCTAGQKLVIVLQGDADFAFSALTLQAESHAVVCGDGHRDLTEECDDGNKMSGDGCSSTCTLELSEVEPNDTAAQANALKPTWVAKISPGTDADFITFQVTPGLTSATLETFDVGDGACALGLLDSYLEIFGTDGSTLLVFDDDGGDGFCSRATAKGLAPGTYYARVTASPEGDLSPFAYSLALSLDP